MVIDNDKYNIKYDILQNHMQSQLHDASVRAGRFIATNLTDQRIDVAASIEGNGQRPREDDPSSLPPTTSS